MKELDYALLNQGYDNQWSLMKDLLTQLDYRLYLLYQYHQWLGPKSDMKNMLGLVVSREEFEHNLSLATQRSLLDQISPREAEQLSGSEAVVQMRLKKTDWSGIPLLRLFQRFELDALQQGCVILAYARWLDQKYEKLLAYLQDDITKKSPTVQTAVQLFLPSHGIAEQVIAGFGVKTPFTSLFEQQELAQGLLTLCEPVTAYLSQPDTLSLPGGYELFNGACQAPDLPLLVGKETADALDGVAEDRNVVVFLHGPSGAGKHFQLRHLMHRRGRACLFVDLEALEWNPEVPDQAAMLARLYGACLCFTNLSGKNTEGESVMPSARLLQAVAQADSGQPVKYILDTQPLHLSGFGSVLELELSQPEADQRVVLFRSALKDAALEEGISAEELAYKFHFLPQQIRLACTQAQSLTAPGKPITSALLHSCCYQQVVHKLDALASKVRPGYTWDDVVLPSDLKRLMQHACSHIRYQHQVYSQWNFSEKISYGRGLSILFAGVPGTGKTMCAQVMAKQLNMELYKINISQIVSKYIGETEKNLQAVFREAKDSNCILFFDECDSLFSKRSEVKDSNDRNANVEVAYLLQQIEEYDGVCILATNLIQNIDAAFMRRITYVAHFPFPDASMRREIYQRTIPEAAPVSADVDWDFLADKFTLSGGHIKNIVLSAAFMAAAQGTSIGMRQLLNSAINEMKKNEIVIVREDLRQYADLID